MRAAETLRREGFDGDITLIGAERHFPPFDRPPLSKQVLVRKWEPEKARLRFASDVDLASLDLTLGVTATALSLETRAIEVSDGGAVAFDGLVIATGTHPRAMPGVEGTDRVFMLRTIDDCLALSEAMEAARHVVVIGAGFIGSEVASTARERGLDVTVIEALEVPLLRVLGRELGEFCADIHRANGVELRLGVGVSGIDADGVHLADGTVVSGDVIVVGIGVAPNTDWLEGSGALVDNGVLCDSRCRVRTAGGVDHVAVAAGDVARWHNPFFGVDMRVEHWTNAAEQAEAAAKTLLHGDDADEYAPIPYFWSDQYDTKLQYVGHHAPGDELRVIEGAVADRRFVAGWGREGRLVAALCVSRPNRTIPMREAIAAREPLPPPAT